MKIILCGFCLVKISTKNYYYIDLRPQNTDLSLIKEKVLCMECAKKVIDQFNNNEKDVDFLILNAKNRILPTESPENE